MLDLDAVENHDNKLQLISTLKSTRMWLQMYGKSYNRYRALQELRREGGPRDLTLPLGSTDNDVERLFLTGPLGNLQSLSLAFTNITNACAEHLIKLPTLISLNMQSTRVSVIMKMLIKNYYY